jgi:hypothetical protein
MKEKPLIKTNAYLRDARLYKKLLFINVSSSAAIELGRLNPILLKALKKEGTPKLTFRSSDKKKK